MLINRQDFINELNAIDRVNDLTDWKYQDIHFWPIVKNIAFFAWHKKYKISFTSANNMISEAPNANRWKELFHNLISSGLGLFSYMKYKIGLKELKGQTIFCGSWSHRVHVDGWFFNRYFDTLINEYKLDNYIFVEYDKIRTKERYPHSQLLVTEHLSMFLNLLGRFQSNRALLTEQLLRHSGILDRLASLIELSKTQLINKIVKTISNINAQANFWAFVIQKAKAQRVLLLCYYNMEPYGLTVASKRIGIESIDMQHGGITSLHQAYGGFSKIPSGGYQTVPHTFWCWDLPTAKIIRTWAKEPNHKVVVGGNPWYVHSAALQNINKFQLKATTNKRVLYTLQYTYLDDFVIETIQQTVHQMDWYLRLHPRELHKRHLLVKQLSEHHLLDRVEIEKASTYPLPVLLQQVSVHVSKFSGSIIEAMGLGVPTIIIDELGFEFATMHSESNLLFPLETRTTEEFVKILSSVLTEYSMKSNFRETVDLQIKETLRQLKIVNQF